MKATGIKYVMSKIIIIPQRYMMGILGLFALANSFTMRVCLSLAITQMVVKVSSDEHIEGVTCPAEETTVTVTRNTTASVSNHIKYDWDEATQGFLLSAFYYGYVLTHLPGGLLAEKFGGKWTLGLGLLSTSVGTILTPWIVRIWGAYGLFVMRVLEGLGEGPVTPAFVLLMARWIPPTERSIMGALIFGGAQVGNVAGPYMSGLIMADGGNWENVFYTFGALGCVWFLFWSVLCYNTPNEHPFITESEQEYLNKTVQASGLHRRLDPVPWRAVLSSKPLWVLIVAAIGHDWGYFTIITDLPKYMTDVLKFNIKSAGIVSALPYVAMYCFSFIFAGLCDLCIRKKWHSIGTGRKIYTTIAATGPAILIIWASYVGCDRVKAVVLFIIAMALMGGFYSSVKINAMDIAPNYAGTVSALVNGIAAISGIITPYLVGLLTPDQTLVQWRNAFWTVFAVLVGTNIVYLFWGSGEQQWWDDINKYGYPEEWKHGQFKTRDVDGEKNVKIPKHLHSPISTD